MIRTDKDFSKYLDAADAVCGECIKCSDENCESCPVRQTIDYYRSRTLETSKPVRLITLQNQEICRETTLVSEKDGSIVIVITDNNKYAKVPKGYSRFGKSYLTYRNVQKAGTDYPHGKEIQNGCYAWISDHHKRWDKITLT